ncbi:MAG: serine/threonine protein kinase [Mariniblastus sp.]|jgi:serine/threonine protein kinase
MSEPSAKSFLKLLERSGIVAENRLKAELANLSSKAAGRKVNVKELAGHLIDSGLITRWHTDKLLAGKYKGFFLGKYKLLGHLGSGGMSSVYLAQHKISEQFRAIKVLPRKKVSDKSYLDRFYLEARAAASLNHPNVVRIYDICNEADTHYMVMEYVRGKDLYEIVKANGPLDFVEAAQSTIQAAEGLGHAHERELVHRDIKPANLLKTEDGTVKLLDLGLALVNQDDSESLTVLYNEKVMGTADYLSPEQAVNSHKVDHRADIYSLGCTLYFLLTGHPPFPKGTLAQRIAMHQTQEPADIRESRPECPIELVEACDRMMVKNADTRIQTCAEVKSLMESLIQSGVLSNVDPKAAVPFEKKKSTSTVKPAGERDSTDVIKIDVGSDSQKGNSRKGSSKSRFPSNEGSKKQMSESQVNAILSPRKRFRNPPKWVLPVAIVVMLVILVATIYMANYLINQKPTQENQAISCLPQSTGLVDVEDQRLAKTWNTSTWNASTWNASTWGWHEGPLQIEFQQSKLGKVSQLHGQT